MYILLLHIHTHYCFHVYISGKYGIGSNTNFTCSGPCAAGYWCNSGSTSPTANECGSPAFYCPEASALPVLVDSGHYSIGGTTNSTHTNQAICEAGSYCQGGVKLPCKAGEIAPEQGRTSCSIPQLGTFIVDQARSLTAMCPAGFYCQEGRILLCGGAEVFCPPGSSFPRTVRSGYYSIGGFNSSTRHNETICEPEFYCLGGERFVCDEGTFSLSEGSVRCLLPGDGNYVAYGDSGLEVKSCEPGSWCSQGIMRECPLGFYSEGGATFCNSADPGSFVPSPGFRIQLECWEGFYSATRGSYECDPCDIGTYSAREGASFCSPAPPGFYIDSFAASTPKECPNGTVSDSPGSDECKPCEAGSVPSPRADFCQPCVAYGLVANATSHQCEPCIDDNALTEDGLTCQCKVGFLFDIPQGTCIRCPLGVVCTQIGVTSANALLEPGYFQPEVDVVEGEIEQFVAPVQCVNIAACEGGNASGINSCGPRRTGMLCAQCIEGLYDWGGECLNCEASTYVPAFGALLVVIWLYVLVIHKISNPQEYSGDAGTKCFLFFTSTFRVITGNEVRWLQWLGLFDGEPTSVTGGKVCYLPLDPSQKLVFQAAVPFMALGFLLLTSGLHWSLTKCRQRRDFSFKPYIRTICSLLIFSYTTISSTTFAYLDCKNFNLEDTGPEVLLVRTEPGLDCNTLEYKRNLNIVYVFLGLVLVLPWMPWLLLRRHHSTGALKDMQSKLGILYETYKLKHFYFESIALFRRTLYVLTLTSPIISIDETLKSQLFVFWSVLFLLIQIFTEPYVLRQDDVFEMISLSTLVAISLFQTGRRDEDILPWNLQVFISVSVLLVFASFILLQLAPMPSVHRRLPSGLASFLAKSGIAPSPGTQGLAVPRQQNQAVSSDSGVLKESGPDAPLGVRQSIEGREGGIEMHPILEIKEDEHDAAGLDGDSGSDSDSNSAGDHEGEVTTTNKAGTFAVAEQEATSSNSEQGRNEYSILSRD